MDSEAVPPNPNLEATQPLRPLTPDAGVEAVRPPVASDATVEMERPADIQLQLKRVVSKPNPSAPPVPVVPVVPQDATVDMARPQNIKPAALDPNITIEMGNAKALNPFAMEATVDVMRPTDLNATQAVGEMRAERRATGRASGVTHVAVTVPAFVPVYAKKLGEVLVQMGKLTAEQVDEAVKLAKETGERLGQCLIRWDVVQPDVICRALSIQTGLPMTVLDEDAMPKNLSRIFPLPLMMHHGFVPFDESAAVLCVAACSPLDAETIKELEKISRKVIEVFVAREDQLARQLQWQRIRVKTRSRRHVRFKKQLEVSYQFCSREGVRTDKLVHQGRTLDMSLGGFLIDGPQPNMGDPGKLMLHGLYVNVCLKAEDGEIWAICEVRELRLELKDEQTRWLMGVEMVDMNAEYKPRLISLCGRKPKPLSEFVTPIPGAVNETEEVMENGGEVSTEAENVAGMS